MISFKNLYSLEKRKETSSRLRDKYPNIVPVIVEAMQSIGTPDIKTTKFLVPGTTTLGKFIYEIRQRIPDLKPQEALFVFVNGSLYPTSKQIYELDHKGRNEDGFLYMTYCMENTFGSDKRILIWTDFNHPNIGSF